MESIKLASGDNNSAQPMSPRYATPDTAEDKKLAEHLDYENENYEQQQEVAMNAESITVETIDDNEAKLKDRISQCKNLIQSLKFELNEEKTKLEKEIKQQQPRMQQVQELPQITAPHYDYNVSTSDDIDDYAFCSNMYSLSVENKLNCDENLLEYEKQLEKYQNTLNKAQIEKKNAIRKQMLTKAYRLKLLEVENQCNIELLRVKQSLQCLEPLQMIANKWNDENEADSYDLNTFELMPRFPELSSNPGIELETVKAALENADAAALKEDSVSNESE